MAPILNQTLFDAPWGDPKFRALPGTRALGADDWIAVDDAYAAQMALRERLIAERRADVIASIPGGDHAARELLAAALEIAPRFGFEVSRDRVVRPDGSAALIDRADPLATLGRLFQEDFCLLERHGDEHVLTAAVLCFPFGWTLSEKIGRAMFRIHKPVASYSPDIARRIERMFTGLKPGRPVWRANIAVVEEPDLFWPKREAVSRPAHREGGGYVRAERQCLVRLPQTGAVAFSIHTCLVAATPEARAKATTPA